MRISRRITLVYLLAALLWAATGEKALAQDKLSATLHENRLDVRIGGMFFTSYIFSDDEKYPYFFPVNGPSGASVTSIRNGQYPHHSSLFFGCDKVNGGNYWQEGLNRGQIVSLRVDLLEDAGDRIVIENECIWTRPGAESPIKDIRRITITAPKDALFQIDFDITLEMLQNVTIEKTNHSLFSGRMDPDLAVVHGGILVNAEGARLEEATFGQPSPWVDYYGNRGLTVEGMAILQHPSNPWYPSPWFTRDYGFFSPTPMYWPENGASTEFMKGESLTLRYRVLVHQGDHKAADIAGRFSAYTQE